MSAEAKARAFRPDDKELDDDTHAALAFLGVNKENRRDDRCGRK